jgi:hypothetical protein
VNFAQRLVACPRFIAFVDKPQIVIDLRTRRILGWQASAQWRAELFQFPACNRRESNDKRDLESQGPASSDEAATWFYGKRAIQNVEMILFDWAVWTFDVIAWYRTALYLSENSSFVVDY